jgi:hypothetical protein
MDSTATTTAAPATPQPTTAAGERSEPAPGGEGAGCPLDLAEKLAAMHIDGEQPGIGEGELCMDGVDPEELAYRRCHAHFVNADYWKTQLGLADWKSTHERLKELQSGLAFGSGDCTRDVNNIRPRVPADTEFTKLEPSGVNEHMALAVVLVRHTWRLAAAAPWPCTLDDLSSGRLTWRVLKGARLAGPPANVQLNGRFICLVGDADRRQARVLCFEGINKPLITVVDLTLPAPPPGTAAAMRLAYAQVGAVVANEHFAVVGTTNGQLYVYQTGVAKARVWPLHAADGSDAARTLKPLEIKALTFRADEPRLLYGMTAKGVLLRMQLALTTAEEQQLTKELLEQCAKRLGELEVQHQEAMAHAAGAEGQAAVEAGQALQQLQHEIDAVRAQLTPEAVAAVVEAETVRRFWARPAAQLTPTLRDDWDDYKEAGCRLYYHTSYEAPLQLHVQPTGAAYAFRPPAEGRPPYDEETVALVTPHMFCVKRRDVFCEPKDAPALINTLLPAPIPGEPDFIVHRDMPAPLRSIAFAGNLLALKGTRAMVRLLLLNTGAVVGEFGVDEPDDEPDNDRATRHYPAVWLGADRLVLMRDDASMLMRLVCKRDEVAAGRRI